MANPLDDLTGKNIIVDDVPMPDRKVLELISGEGVVLEAADDSVNGRTVITVTAEGGGASMAAVPVVVFVAGKQRIDSEVAEVIGAREFDLADYPETVGDLARVVRFEVTLRTTDESVDVSAELYNATTLATVDTLGTNSEAATRLQSDPLELDEGPNMYEVNLSCDVAPGGEAAICYYAALVVTWE